MLGEPEELVKSIQTVITVFVASWSVLCLETWPIMVQITMVMVQVTTVMVQVTMVMVQITICVKTDAGSAPGIKVVDLHRTVWNSDSVSETGQKSKPVIWVWSLKVWCIWESTLK